MNDDLEVYDCIMESLLLNFDKSFHFCSKDTQVNMNRTFQIIGLLLSCLVSDAFCFKWLTQTFVDCNLIIKTK